MTTNVYADDEDPHASIFRPPNDEEVFVTRETEKQKRKEAKERAKNLKIWEKNTATSAAPLHRVKDRDISPAEKDDQQKNKKPTYNQMERKNINRAMMVAKTRVQFPKEQRAQNATEFVDQKKEMFLAELAYNTVEQEIKELEERQQRRNESLIESQKELENDKMDLHQYIARDKQMKEEKEDQEKLLISEKLSKEDKIKQLDQKIAQAKSEIDKHKDTLISLESNQKFLLELSPDAFQTARKEDYKRKYREVKQAWIQKHKADPYLDQDIVYRDDEEIHEQVRMRFGFLAQINSGGPEARRKAMNQWTQYHSQITEEEWEFRFKQLLKLSLIDVPDEFYKDDLFFTDPQDLKEIFQRLEEDNLKMIHDQQELMQNYELLLQYEQQKRRELDSDFEEQDRARIELQTKIESSRSILTLLKKRSQNSMVEHNKDSSSGTAQAKDKQKTTDFSALLNKLRNKIKQIHVNCIGQGEVASKPTLALLNEIEVRVIKYIRNVARRRELDKDAVLKIEKERGLMYKTELTTLRLKEQTEEEERKNQNYQLKKQKKRVKFGKMNMQRSQKISIKRKEAVKEINPERLAFLQYLGHLSDEEEQNAQK